MTPAAKGLLKLIDLFRVFIESIGNKVECFIWNKRQTLVFFGVFGMIIYPLVTMVTGSFKDVTPIRIFAEKLMVEEARTDTSRYLYALSKDTSGKFYLFIIVILFILLLEFCSRTLGYYLKQVTIGDRIFVTIAYLWAWTELTMTYTDYVINWLREFSLINVDQFIVLTGPYFDMYTNLPGTKLGILGLLVFFLFFYGIGRNKDIFKFFIRYHFVQAVLFSALFSVQGHLFFLLIKLDTGLYTNFSNFLGTTFYLFDLVILVCCSFSAIIGIETYFPFMHDAIQYHSGRKEDEYKGLLEE
tara:strand:+ start:87 stop:986 length:900 start_codon:yes stop_codon:yes gene_type:complete